MLLKAHRHAAYLRLIPLQRDQISAFLPLTSQVLSPRVGYTGVDLRKPSRQSRPCPLTKRDQRAAHEWNRKKSVCLRFTSSSNFERKTSRESGSR